mmetsp:Transcript_6574/g.11054  ORF Transcript_6574/g.11054 Transcript_6574/m.11054 type:complete len:366 (+) Transcript_6574:79-1176(+)
MLIYMAAFITTAKMAHQSALTNEHKQKTNLESCDWAVALAREIRLVAEQITDVFYLVLDHRGSLERQTPGNDAHVSGQAHREQHFGSEHTGITQLGPLAQLGVVAENLHGGFGVRVVGRLEAQLRDADLLEEGLDQADQMSQGEIAVRDETLDLVELTQVRGVHRFITEHTVDREVLLRCEYPRGGVLLAELVEHLRRNGRGVGAQNVLRGLLALEVAAIADTASVATVLVGLLHHGVVLLRDRIARSGTLHEESIVRIAGRVTLRLEQCVEVPEGRLDPLARGHLFKAHLHQDAAEFGTHLEQRVEVSASYGSTHGLQVDGLVAQLTPVCSRLHFVLISQVGLIEAKNLANSHRLEFLASGDLG